MALLSFLELLLTASRGQRTALVYLVEVISNACAFAGALSRVWRAGLLVCPMPKGLRRYCGQRHLRFIACSCYRLLPLLRSPQARNGTLKDRKALRPMKPGTGVRWSTWQVQVPIKE